MPEHRQDPQDKQFGAQARRDQEVVDEREAEGEEVSEDQSAPPRAAGKAEPADNDR